MKKDTIVIVLLIIIVVLLLVVINQNHQILQTINSAGNYLSEKLDILGSYVK